MSARHGPLVARMAVLVVVGLSGLSAEAKYGGGSGTAKDPWRIASKKDLLAFAAEPKDYGSHVILTADIDLSGQTFPMAVIAPATETGPHLEFLATPFTGVFNGNGHKITGLTIDDRNREPGYFGLFGCIARGGLVKNLRLERVSIVNAGMGVYIGGLVGRNDGGTITNCSVNGIVDGGEGSDDLGALAGRNDPGGRIADCRATTNPTSSTTSGNCNVGGLVGHNALGATISGCEAAGAVTGSGSIQLNPGGLVGINRGLIKHCRAEGNVTGNTEAGGLVAWNDGMIIHCSAAGKVAAERGAGGGGLVVTNTQGAVIVNCNASGAVACGRFTGWGGGLVGANSGVIVRCWAMGKVTGEESAAGGLAGINHGIIDNSYATGSVTTSRGLSGGLTGWNEGTIANCFSVGKVGGTSPRPGGLAGIASLTGPTGETVNSFWDIQTSGQSKSGGGTGKTTGQMKTAKTFRDAWWDFNCVWDIEEGRTYPFLRPGLVADLNCDGKVNLRDYAKLAANWSKTCSFTNPKAPVVKCPLAGDLTCDRQVNAQDLALMAAQWLEGR